MNGIGGWKKGIWQRENLKMAFFHQENEMLLNSQNKKVHFKHRKTTTRRRQTPGEGMAGGTRAPVLQGSKEVPLLSGAALGARLRLSLVLLFRTEVPSRLLKSLIDENHLQQPTRHGKETR